MHRDRVLFVEDDVIVALVIATFLREQGFEVTSVDGASAAIVALSEKRPYAALVTDINLGPGVDGYGVARSARIRCPATAVIYVSASGAGRHVGEGVRGSQFIAKPFEPYEIHRALAQILILSA